MNARIETSVKSKAQIEAATAELCAGHSSSMRATKDQDVSHDAVLEEAEQDICLRAVPMRRGPLQNTTWKASGRAWIW